MASPDPDIDVRAAVPADVKQLTELIAPFIASRKLLPRGVEELEKLTANGFVAELEQRVVGFAAVEVYSQKLAELQCLAVSADCQGRGIGKVLISHCLTRARELGVRELMAITASERLFIDCGFHYSLPDQKKALFIQP